MARSQRLPPAQILAQLERARSEASLVPVLDAAAEMMAILDDQRRLAFANKAMLGFTGSASVEQLYGEGEAFHETLRTGAVAPARQRWTCSRAPCRSSSTASASSCSP
jgi:hypothetical protein